MISTDHTSFSIKWFIEHVINNGKKIYGQRLKQPKILIMDFSLALISGAIMAYNQQTITTYLDICYDYVNGKTVILPPTLVFVCAAHILNRVKIFLKQKKSQNVHLILKLMGKLITSTDMKEIKKIAEVSQVVFDSRKITKQVLENTAVLEQMINDKYIPTLVENLDGDESIEITDDTTSFEGDDEERAILTSKFSRLWKNFFLQKSNSEQNNQQCESGSPNTLFEPDFFKKLANWYLPSSSLWTKIIIANVTDEYKQPTNISNVVHNSLAKDANTNVHAELMFRLKKYTTFQNQRNLPVDEFINENAKDNVGIFRQVSIAVLQKLKDINQKGSNFNNTYKISRFHSQNGLLNPSSFDTEDEMPSKPAIEKWNKPETTPAQKKSYLSKNHPPQIIDPASQEKTKVRTPKPTKAEKDRVWKEGLKTGKFKGMECTDVKEIVNKEAKRRKAKSASIEISHESSGPYTCCLCKHSAPRSGVIFCTECRNFYHHSGCYLKMAYSYKLSLYTDSQCVCCQISAFRRIGIHLYKSIDWDQVQSGFENLPDRVEQICANWDKKTNLSDIIIDYPSSSPLENKKSFAIKLSNRGFDNKSSNCWLACVMQCFYPTPFRGIVNRSSSNLGKLCRDMFQDMGKENPCGMSTDKLGKIATECDRLMDLRAHQDAGELYTKIIQKLTEDMAINDELRIAFSINSIRIFICKICNQISGKPDTETHIACYLPDSKSKFEVSSLVYSSLHGGILSKLWESCKQNTKHRQSSLVYEFPEVLVVSFNRTIYNKNKSTSSVSNAGVVVDELDISHASIHNMLGSQIKY